MKRKKIAVAGSEGFIGSHVLKQLRSGGMFEGVAVPRVLWNSPAELSALLAECDAVIMLAGVSRSDDGEQLYRTNMELVQKLIAALSETSCRVIFGSTTHEAKQTFYHASKRDGAALLAASAAAETVTVLMPNTFGPGGKPFYNSVVSTFCYQAANGETMSVAPGAGEVLLIDVHTLAAELIRLAAGDYPGERVVLKHRFAVPVQQIADLLDDFRKNGKNIRKDEFSELLYETFESYKKQEKWC